MIPIFPLASYLSLRVAYPYDGKEVSVTLDGKEVARLDIPNTGGFQEWQTVTVPGIVLPESTGKVLRFTSPKGGPNMNWMRLDFVDTTVE